MYLFKNKRNTLFALGFGFFFCIVNQTGSLLEKSLTISKIQCVYLLLMSFLPGLVVGEIYLRLRERVAQIEKDIKIEINAINERKYFLLCALFLLIAYIPVFLAYYPGLFAYDVMAQIPQGFETGYSTHHPLIHTLYLQFFYYVIGGKLMHNFTSGIACAAIVQMVLFSCMLSWIHLFLYRAGISRIIRMVLIILTAVLPFFSVLAVSMTKDVFFSGFVGILLVCFCYWEIFPEYYDKTKNVVFYIISIMGTILFRNNGIYAVIIAFVVSSICCKTYRANKKFVIYTTAGILMAIFVSAGLKTAMSATDGSANEALSLPYQQLSYVYHVESGQLSPEDKSDILTLVPNVENYLPHISDPIKDTATGMSNKKKFIKTYLKLFIEHPMHYVEAFLQNNLGYFYIFDTTHACIYGNTPEDRQGYLLTNTKAGFGVEHTTYFAALENLYEYLYTINKYQNILPLRILCSPAFYFWIFAVIFFLAVDLHRKSWLSLSFLIGLLLTILAGPCALIRYALPYIIGLPAVCVSVCFYRQS